MFLDVYLYIEKMTTAPPSRPYHHGDLRRALLEEALRALAEHGPAALSLRDLARRVGVSHAAPRHHFGDKPGLLTAVAVEGFHLLADELGETYRRTGSFLEVGVAYVRFATRHRAHFEVMFRPDLCRRDDPALVAARSSSAALLYGPVAERTGELDAQRVTTAGIAAWSLVHGLATLYVSGNLPGRLGEDPEQIARAAAAYLFPADEARRQER